MTYENDWYRALNVYYDVEKMQPFGDTQRIAYEPRGGATRAIRMLTDWNTVVL
jgi:hypothetical protein